MTVFPSFLADATRWSQIYRPHVVLPGSHSRHLLEMEDPHSAVERQHCRFYENNFPKIDDVVMVEVRPRAQRRKPRLPVPVVREFLLSCHLIFALDPS